MRRCSNCILPDNYPGIHFNQDGKCNYCISSQPRHYLGGEAMREAIISYRPAKMERNSAYDCVLALSGGRDSSFLLHYLVKELGLNVIAYCVDNGFMPAQTKRNIENMVDILDVKLIVEKYPHLQKCVNHHLRSWMHKPSPAMVGLLCTGCRFDIDVGVTSFAMKSKIPIIVTGSTPLEGGVYKKELMKTNPYNKRTTSFFMGFILQITQNPMWIMNPTCFITQIREYYFHFVKRAKQKELLPVRAFGTYIRWEEERVVNTIQNELNWKKRSNTESSWRGDCDIALLKLYLYKQTIGFNDKDDGFSCLIRDGQMTREEALSRVSDEGEIPEKVIIEIMNGLGLDFKYMKIPQ